MSKRSRRSKSSEGSQTNPTSEKAAGSEGRLTIRCPDCGTDLIVDATTGQILHHRAVKAPVAGGKSFDDLFAGLDEQKERAEALFEQGQAAHKDSDRLLEEKFAEAMKKADELDDDEPPPRPFDFD